MPIFLIWLAYRLLTSFWAFLLSATHPITALERSLPLWPPSPNLGTWLERVWLLPWQRWDVDWYLKIVNSGYQSGDGTAQFHPLYAWLALPLARLGLDPLLSLFLVSSLAALAFMFVFEACAKLDLDPKTSRVATVLMVSFPVGFILFAPYTESLFLLCAAACFIFMRGQKWIRAGIFGGLAALTRQQGIFLIFPLVWELWEYSARDLKTAGTRWRVWLAALGPPAGLMAWFFYRAAVLHDFPINPLDIKSLVYSGLISSSAVKVVPVYQFTWPWQALGLAFEHLIKSPDVDILIDLVLGALFIIMLVLTWSRMRVSYRIYSVVIALISFSYYTGPIHPYMGLPRHLFLAFPVFIGLAPMLANRRRWLVYTSVGLLGMLFIMTGYVLMAGFPERHTIGVTTDD